MNLMDIWVYGVCLVFLAASVYSGVCWWKEEDDAQAA